MEQIERFLNLCREQRIFSGAVYAFGNSSGWNMRGAVGTLSWDGAEVGLDSIWDLASVSKPIAMLPYMVYLEQGKLSLDETVADFLPHYAGTDKADITLRQLLTHSGGIPGQQPLYKTASTREALMDAVRALPLWFAPGTDVAYTSQGYMILGDMLEAIAGKRLDAILQETVFDPLGMAETMFNPPERLRPRIAATEYCPWRGRVVCGEVHDENAVVLGGVAGHAGLFSTVGDMALLARAMLDTGRGRRNDWLQPETVRLMTRNHTPKLKLARGLGWQGKDAEHSHAGDLFSAASYGHTGFTGTSIWIDPEQELFAVLLTNRVHPTRDNPRIKRARAIFHNLVWLAAQKARHE